MTTMTPRGKAVCKPLGIRSEFLPDSAKHVTIDGDEYVMIPVKDFGDWYENIEDNAIAEYAADVPRSVVPLAEVEAEILGGRERRRR